MLCKADHGDDPLMQPAGGAWLLLAGQAGRQAGKASGAAAAIAVLAIAVLATVVLATAAAALVPVPAAFRTCPVISRD